MTLQLAQFSIDESHSLRVEAAPAAHRVEIEVLATGRIEDVEAAWRLLEAKGLESPGQSYDFVRRWVAHHRIAPAAQCYLLATIGGAPVALLPLHRRRALGVRALTWFAGPQVGCNAPIVDRDRLLAMGPEGRRALWSRLLARAPQVDLVALRAVPADDIYAELGSSVAVETLHRASFSSWEEADRTQRSRSRRKHDRQQGDRLAALGKAQLETLTNGDDVCAALETMFAQRAARFRQMGVPDSFAKGDLTRFYAEAMRPGSGVDVVMHVLRLDGEIVATRFSIAHGERLFCLISSMSIDPRLQAGSPGKQCLLRVMQTVFEEGVTMFDMGAGLTDEKRHWCNVTVSLRRHYVPLTLTGRVVAAAHEAFSRARAHAKADGRLTALRRALGRQFGSRRPARSDARDEA